MESIPLPGPLEDDENDRKKEDSIIKKRSRKKTSIVSLNTRINGKLVRVSTYRHENETGDDGIEVQARHYATGQVSTTLVAQRDWAHFNPSKLENMEEENIEELARQLCAEARLRSVDRNSLMVDLSLLNQLSLFSHILPAAPKQLQDLKTDFLEHLVPEPYEEGYKVMSQGQQGHEMYFIGSGRVGIYLSDIKVGELRAGSYFGELAIFRRDSLRTATIICEDSCLLFSIARGHVGLLCKRHPELKKIMEMEFSQYKFDESEE
jgi:hypothetical protein